MAVVSTEDWLIAMLFYVEKSSAFVTIAVGAFAGNRD
jgi:hypothetical protein